MHDLCYACSLLLIFNYLLIKWEKKCCGKSYWLIYYQIFNSFRTHLSVCVCDHAPHVKLCMLFESLWSYLSQRCVFVWVNIFSLARLMDLTSWLLAALGGQYAFMRAGLRRIELRLSRWRASVTGMVAVNRNVCDVQYCVRCVVKCMSWLCLCVQVCWWRS